MWLRAPHLESTHGFSTRAGGVSEAPYASLNLSVRVGDREDRVLENRRVALEALGLKPESVMLLRQVHSGDVVTVDGGTLERSGHIEADALVTALSGVTLAIETADCYPILLEDRALGIVGAAHAGWRGTVARIAANTLEAMVRLGAKPERVRAAIGPGICGANYAVGNEVLERFAEAGFPGAFVQPDAAGALRADLAAANAWLLEDSGVPASNIWRADRCSTETDFFSYRRDAGTTGRMWAVIAAGRPTA